LGICIQTLTHVVFLKVGQYFACYRNNYTFGTKFPHSCNGMKFHIIIIFYFQRQSFQTHKHKFLLVCIWWHKLSIQFNASHYTRNCNQDCLEPINSLHMFFSILFICLTGQISPWTDWTHGIWITDITLFLFMINGSYICVSRALQRHFKTIPKFPLMSLKREIKWTTFSDHTINSFADKNPGVNVTRISLSISVCYQVRIARITFTGFVKNTTDSMATVQWRT